MNETCIGNKYHIGDKVMYKLYFNRFPAESPMNEYSGTIISMDNNGTNVYYQILRDSDENKIDYVNEFSITELIEPYISNKKKESNEIHIVLDNMKETR